MMGIFAITLIRVFPNGGIGTFNDTGIQVTLAYGDGSTVVEGDIGVSPFQFGSYSVDRQGELIANA